MSLNNAARKLLGEQNPESATDSKLKPTIPELPGDSVRSARIERAVSAWAAPTPSIPAARPAAIRPSVTSTGSMPPVDLSTSISPATTQAHGTTAPSPVSSQTAGSVSPSAAGLQQSPATAPEQGSDNVSDKTIRSGPNAQLVATEQERAAESAATEHEHQPNRPSVNQDVRPYQAGTRFCSETEFPNQAISIRQGISISNAVWEPCTLGRWVALSPCVRESTRVTAPAACTTTSPSIGRTRSQTGPNNPSAMASSLVRTKLGLADNRATGKLYPQVVHPARHTASASAAPPRPVTRLG